MPKSCSSTPTVSYIVYLSVERPSCKPTSGINPVKRSHNIHRLIRDSEFLPDSWEFLYVTNPNDLTLQNHRSAIKVSLRCLTLLSRALMINQDSLQRCSWKNLLCAAVLHHHAPGAELFSTGQSQISIKIHTWNFPHGQVVTNSHCTAGDMGSTPSLGRFHMLWGT